VVVVQLAVAAAVEAAAVAPAVAKVAVVEVVAAPSVGATLRSSFQRCAWSECLYIIDEKRVFLRILLTYLLFNSPKQGRQSLAGLCWRRSRAEAPVP
jgi:hypothetical protein